MKDCAWCGMPMEEINRWEKRQYVLFNDGTSDFKRTEHLVARCLNDHWYGGPAEELADVL